MCVSRGGVNVYVCMPQCGVTQGWGECTLLGTQTGRTTRVCCRGCWPMLVFHLCLLDFPVTDNNWTLQCREPGIASFLSPPRSVIFPVFILWSCMSWKQHRFCSTFAIQLKEDPNLCVDGTQRSETVGQNVRFSFLQLKHPVEAL